MLWSLLSSTSFLFIRLSFFPPSIAHLPSLLPHSPISSSHPSLLSLPIFLPSSASSFLHAPFPCLLFPSPFPIPLLPLQHPF
ncbi:hypothetical protein B0H19DRAFT_1159495 [Mycena capillaripes]|nr:hypothetical protein B0H19DRAFT_1159495 [Mycena capillaripes]